MKTSKKGLKKFVIEFRQWLAPTKLQKFTTFADSKESALDKFKLSYETYEYQHKEFRPYDILKIYPEKKEQIT